MNVRVGTENAEVAVVVCIPAGKDLESLLPVSSGRRHGAIPFPSYILGCVLPPFIAQIHVCEQGADGGEQCTPGAFDGRVLGGTVWFRPGSRHVPFAVFQVRQKVVHQLVVVLGAVVSVDVPHTQPMEVHRVKETLETCQDRVGRLVGDAEIDRNSARVVEESKDVPVSLVGCHTHVFRVDTPPLPRRSTQPTTEVVP